MTTPPDDMGNGPVIRDHRRIDPVTGQVRRGKHAASQPAGTPGAGRPDGTRPGAGLDPGAGGHDGPGGNASGRHGRSESRSESGEANVMREQDITANEDGTTEPADVAAEESAPAAEAPKVPTFTPASKEPADGEPAGKETDKSDKQVEKALAERTADLQRLQAEYANYRKRVERDRAAVKEAAVASVLTELLPVLDAIGQAREHGELSGGFKSVADSLLATVTKLGLVTYGDKGEPFDPKIHEALASMASPDVTEETCIDILQPGYRVGERILRPARVAVAEPAPDSDNGNDDTD
jgi:molecular chaperone GrpE